VQAITLLGEFALRAAFLGVTGAIAAWLFRRRGVETQHAIWRMVLAGMLALPLLMAVVPALPFLPSREVVMTRAVGLLRISRSVGIVETRFSFGQIPPADASSDASGSSPRGASTPTWPLAALAVYMAITAALLSRIAFAVKRAIQVSSAAARVSVGLLDELEYPRPEVRESRELTVPFTIGRRNPVIVLPAGWREWGDFKLRSVLIHEVAHVRRADWSTSLAAAVNRAVFWFHPLAWWLERRLAHLAEEACDAVAIRSAGDAPGYAKVVLEFALIATLPRVAGTNSMAHASQVGRRVRSIIEGRAALSKRVGGLTWILILTITFPAVYAAAALQPTGQRQMAPPTSSPTSPYSSMPPLEASQTGQRQTAPPTSSPTSPYSSTSLEASRAILSDGWNLTTAEAVSLESELQQDPENLSARIRLISHYTQRMVQPERRTAHLLWLIEHHPDLDVFQTGHHITGVFADYTGLNSPDNVERARILWLRQTERFATNPNVLANAATAFAGTDPVLAVEFVQRARAADPDNPEWLDWLGAIYATAARISLAGGSTVWLAGRAGTTHPAFLLPLPQSDLLRRELDTSSDAALLAATAAELLRESSLLNKRPGPLQSEVQMSETYGRQLLLRAKQLDPGNPLLK
jgi:beta-lactamase regulating signal transducer with metallopeptidase domain